MTKVGLAVSAFAQVDKVARLRCAISARIRGLEFQFINILGRPEELLSGFSDEIRFLQSLVLLLDDYSVVCNTYSKVFRTWKAFPESLELHSIKVLGSFTKRKYDPLYRLNKLKACNPVNIVAVEKEQFLVELLAKLTEIYVHGSKCGRKAEMVRRLGIEIESRYEQGWFFVFNTLTCDDLSLGKVFRKDGSSSVWTDYVRSVDRYFGVTSFGDWRSALSARSRGDEFHSYFAVVESGARTGREHIHVLHCFKSLPGDFVDPNVGLSVPKRRCVDAFRRFWKYGYSMPVAVRFSDVDSFGRLGWRWPVEFNDSKSGYFAVVAKPFCAIISYIGKYVSKSLDSDKEPGCLWRVRMSRKLGQVPIQSVVFRLSLNQRLTLLQLPFLKLSLKLSRMPRMLLRRLLLRSLPRSVFRLLFLRALRLPRVNLFKRLRDMTLGIGVFSQQSVGDTVIRISRIRVACDLFQQSKSYTSVAGASYVLR